MNLPLDDFINKNILFVVDNFSKYFKVFRVKETNSITTANCLIQILSRYEWVRYIRLDLIIQFNGGIYCQLIKLMDIEQVLTAGFRNQINFIVERVNTEMKSYL